MLDGKVRVDDILDDEEKTKGAKRWHGGEQGWLLTPTQIVLSESSPPEPPPPFSVAQSTRIRSPSQSQIRVLPHRRLAHKERPTHLRYNPSGVAAEVWFDVRGVRREPTWELGLSAAPNSAPRALSQQPPPPSRRRASTSGSPRSNAAFADGRFRPTGRMECVVQYRAREFPRSACLR